MQRAIDRSGVGGASAKVLRSRLTKATATRISTTAAGAARVGRIRIPPGGRSSPATGALRAGPHVLEARNPAPSARRRKQLVWKLKSPSHQPLHHLFETWRQSSLFSAWMAAVGHLGFCLSVAPVCPPKLFWFAPFLLLRSAYRQHTVKNLTTLRNAAKRQCCSVVVERWRQRTQIKARGGTRFSSRTAPGSSASAAPPTPSAGPGRIGSTFKVSLTYAGGLRRVLTIGKLTPETLRAQAAESSELRSRAVELFGAVWAQKLFPTLRRLPDPGAVEEFESTTSCSSTAEEEQQIDLSAINLAPARDVFRSTLVSFNPNRGKVEHAVPLRIRHSRWFKDPRYFILSERVEQENPLLTAEKTVRAELDLTQMRKKIARALAPRLKAETVSREGAGPQGTRTSGLVFTRGRRTRSAASTAGKTRTGTPFTPAGVEVMKLSSLRETARRKCASTPPTNSFNRAAKLRRTVSSLRDAKSPPTVTSLQELQTQERASRAAASQGQQASCRSANPEAPVPPAALEQDQVRWSTNVGSRRPPPPLVPDTVTDASASTASDENKQQRGAAASSGSASAAQQHNSNRSQNQMPGLTPQQRVELLLARKLQRYQASLLNFWDRFYGPRFGSAFASTEDALHLDGPSRSKRSDATRPKAKNLKERRRKGRRENSSDAAHECEVLQPQRQHQPSGSPSPPASSSSPAPVYDFGQLTFRSKDWQLQLPVARIPTAAQTPFHLIGRPWHLMTKHELRQYKRASNKPSAEKINSERKNEHDHENELGVVEVGPFSFQFTAAQHPEQAKIGRLGQPVHHEVRGMLRSDRRHAIQTMIGGLLLWSISHFIFLL